MDLERERENPRNDNFRQSRETIDRNTRESRERERDDRGREIRFDKLEAEPSFSLQTTKTQTSESPLIDRPHVNGAYMYILYIYIYTHTYTYTYTYTYVNVYISI